jgi:hypothetical protein
VFSGETGANPTTEIEVVAREKLSDDLLFGLFRFRNTCKKLLAALASSGIIRPRHMCDSERSARKLVEVIVARLDAELLSVRSFLPPGILVWRFDPTVVALNNAINYINQAQLETRPCACVYCAGAPFYAPKKSPSPVILLERKVGRA